MPVSHFLPRFRFRSLRLALAAVAGPLALAPWLAAQGRVPAPVVDARWDAPGVSLAVRLEPRFWQSWWFGTLAVLVLVAGALVVHRVRARRARRAAEREELRRQVDSIVESISDGFVALDAECRFTYVNRTAEAMLGIPRAAALGRVCWEMLSEPLRARLEPEVRRIMADRQPAVVEAFVAGRWLELHAHPAEEGVSVYFADITVRKEAEAALRSLSLRDELTGLYNRRGLLALAEHAMRAAGRRGRGFDVVFMDMDGLKAINDSQGHVQGDQALVDVAAVLRRTLRESDVLARLGGDEFAALLLDDGSADAARVGERVRAAVERENAASRRPYHLSLSIGHSRFEPSRPASVEELLAEADRRMYEEKRRKRVAVR